MIKFLQDLFFKLFILPKIRCELCDSNNIKLITEKEEFVYKHISTFFKVQYLECQDCKDKMLLDEQGWFDKVHEFEKYVNNYRKD